MHLLENTPQLPSLPPETGENITLGILQMRLPPSALAAAASHSGLTARECVTQLALRLGYPSLTEIIPCRIHLCFQRRPHPWHHGTNAAQTQRSLRNPTARPHRVLTTASVHAHGPAPQGRRLQRALTCGPRRPWAAERRPPPPQTLGRHTPTSPHAPRAPRSPPRPAPPAPQPLPLPQPAQPHAWSGKHHRVVQGAATFCYLSYLKGNVAGQNIDYGQPTHGVSGTVCWENMVASEMPNEHRASVVQQQGRRYACAAQRWHKRECSGGSRSEMNMMHVCVENVLQQQRANVPVRDVSSALARRTSSRGQARVANCHTAKVPKCLRRRAARPSAAAA